MSCAVSTSYHALIFRGSVSGCHKISACSSFCSCRDAAAMQYPVRVRRCSLPAWKQGASLLTKMSEMFWRGWMAHSSWGALATASWRTNLTSTGTPGVSEPTSSMNRPSRFALSLTCAADCLLTHFRGVWTQQDHGRLAHLACQDLPGATQAHQCCSTWASECIAGNVSTPHDLLRGKCHNM